MSYHESLTHKLQNLNLDVSKESNKSKNYKIVKRRIEAHVCSYNKKTDHLINVFQSTCTNLKFDYVNLSDTYSQYSHKLNTSHYRDRVIHSITSVNPFAMTVGGYIVVDSQPVDDGHQHIHFTSGFPAFIFGGINTINVTSKVGNSLYVIVYSELSTTEMDDFFKPFKKFDYNEIIKNHENYENHKDYENHEDEMIHVLIGDKYWTIHIPTTMSAFAFQAQT